MELNTDGNHINIVWWHLRECSLELKLNIDHVNVISGVYWTEFYSSYNFSVNSKAVDMRLYVQVQASVVTALKVSLTRQQYEQLLETASYMLSERVPQHSDLSTIERPLQDIEEDTELTGVTTLNLDPKLRARMYVNAPTNQELRQQSSFILKGEILIDGKLYLFLHNNC